MDNELLQSILKELQETNAMLRCYLTENGHATADAIHSYIAEMNTKVDEITQCTRKIAKSSLS